MNGRLGAKGKMIGERIAKIVLFLKFDRDDGEDGDRHGKAEWEAILSTYPLHEPALTVNPLRQRN